MNMYSNSSSPINKLLHREVFCCEVFSGHVMEAWIMTVKALVHYTEISLHFRVQCGGT